MNVSNITGSCFCGSSFQNYHKFYYEFEHDSISCFFFFQHQFSKETIDFVKSKLSEKPNALTLYSAIGALDNVGQKGSLIKLASQLHCLVIDFF